MTAVVFMSLSCLLAALVLRINTLQDELDASRDPCQIAGSQDECSKYEHMDIPPLLEPKDDTPTPNNKDEYNTRTNEEGLQG